MHFSRRGVKPFGMASSKHLSEERGISNFRDAREEGESRVDGKENLHGDNKSFWEHWNIGAISYYFSNFPDNWQRLDLHKIFARFGKVRDIYIARKSNKEGKRFGFARFVEVADERQLENRLQNIWIGDMRMEVNLPKFQTKSTFQVRSRRFIPGQSHQCLRGAKSYAEICKGPHLAEKVVDHRDSAKTTTSDGVKKWLGREYNVKQDDMAWLKNCLVGIAKNPDRIDQLQEQIHKFGLLGVKVIPMGGSMVLLQAEDEISISGLKEDGDWFESVFPWSPSVNSSQRFVWVRCVGVPIHAWCIDFFRYLSRGLGKFVKVDENTRAKFRLDIGRFLVQTASVAKIDRVMKVKINGQVYSISVMEDIHPLPYGGVSGVPDKCSSVAGLRVGTAKVWSPHFPASECDDSGEEDEEASVGSRDKIIMQDSSDEYIGRGRIGRGEFQDGVAAKESAKELLSASEAEGLEKVKSFAKVLSCGDSLDDLSRVRESLCPVPLGLEFGPDMHGPNEVAMVRENQQASESLDMGHQLVNMFPARGLPDGTNIKTNSGSRAQPLGSGIIAEQPLNIRKQGIRKGKKARKMKKLVLAENEDFFQDMESETNRLASAQEEISSRRSRRGDKRRKKLRLRTSLESISETGNSQRGVSGDSKYFVDCRQKRDSAMNEARREAEEMWDMGKELGVSARSDARVVIEKLVEMECRDREAMVDDACGNNKVEESGSGSHQFDEDS